jgi:hypothetical protein
VGVVKSQWIDAQERGWSDIEDKYVCVKCVEDDFLKEQIRRSASAKKCDYCGTRSRKPIAAPVGVVQELVASTVFHFYAEPTQAGVPYDGGWVVEPESTDDVLQSIGLVCNDDLYQEIGDAFTVDAWVRAAQGHWATPHRHEILKYSWYRFSEWIKHETRFFFPMSSYPAIERDPHDLEPDQMLRAVGALARDLKLIKIERAALPLYRARQRPEGSTWVADETSMGAPPADLASAGRMNPAGISYLYLAYEERTAMQEVLRDGTGSVQTAKFLSTRDLRILDLADLPEEPSIFDSERRDQREGLVFLREFVEAICEPIGIDGQEHINYVPSQVVSEFFALVFQDADGNGIDGIAYRSAVAAGGKNLVLFPSSRGIERRFDMVVFSGSGKPKLFQGTSESTLT